ncbi:GGDEF domain-containing protein [Polyangium sp. y55x31]|uniref:GGDEF domain-containing protein n=1 Tax=Polyangium sp. y55x31 TaxID=3042688 RepID=UPI0024830D8E|nr:GGDEF domain-containing protein [Polyangium sp. y55x31]MDI1484498.1 GGDEF domain-containing protein [Polyangium sp. y55x31]
MSRMDARIREMQFLARLDREGEIKHPGGFEHIEHQEMVLSLLHDGYINDIGSLAWGGGEAFAGEFNQLRQAREKKRWQEIGDLLHGAKVDLTFRISHKGRVRLSELQQQLRTGRDRDPTGLCLAKRHLETDLTIALMSASNETPLSVVYLDMNGLKAINDKHRHVGGDAAIKAYLEAVVATFGERGEAYRGEGGDEVIVILPNVDDAAAAKLLANFTRQLAKDVLDLNGEALILTASCGSACTMDPNQDAVGDLADKAQYRAKEESKKHDPRVSAIAVGSGDVTIFNPHNREI